MYWSRFLLVGLSGVAVYIVLPDGPARTSLYVVLMVSSSLALLVGARMYYSLNGTARMLLTAGLLAPVVGDGLTRVAGSHDFPATVAHVVFAVGHCAFLAGFLSLRDTNGRVFHVEDLLESSIVAIGFGLTAWVLAVETRVDETANLMTLTQYWPVFAFAGMDGFLLSLMVTLLLSKRSKLAPWILSTVALLLLYASRWTTYAASMTGNSHPTAVEVWWLLAYVSTAAVALYPHVLVWSVPEDPRQRLVVDRTRLFGITAAVLIAPVVMAVQLVRGVPASEWGWVVLGSSVTAVALTAARMACFLSVLRNQAATLSEIAISDSVTGLANRRHLGELLQRSIASAGESGVVVLVVDIDRFAQINETFGYPAGDRVLREIGERLQSSASVDAVVGRLGGDQFVVSMCADAMTMTTPEYAAHFQRSVSRTMFVGDINVALEATVGIASSARVPGVEAEALLQYAHVALTAAKSGNTRMSVYSPVMDGARHDQMRLLGELETALRLRQLRVFFQPCLDLKTGTVVGIEALLRWDHPREGLMTPGSFLADAERTGLLPAITAYVLEDALACCGSLWRDGSNIRVAVNLSVRNLLDATLIEQVANALARHDVPSTAVEFEVTETSAMTDPRRSVDSLVALRDLGVTIAIDDYGTGYSSLAYLRSLPVQTLKIDKSFVTAMNSQPTNESIVRSTIGLARSLGMTVVAEGVEDAATLDLLRAAGCDGAQGYHIGRPVPAVELPELIRRIEATESRWPTRPLRFLEASALGSDAEDHFEFEQ